MVKSTRGKGRVFLSHSSKDRAFTLRLVKVLERRQIPYWYSATDINGAKQWHDEIGRASVQCDWFLVILTPNAIRSRWVKRELLFALDEDRYNQRIIPLLYKPCKYSRLSWTLPGFELADFTTTFEDGCKALLRVWGIEYKPEDGGLKPSKPKKKLK